MNNNIEEDIKILKSMIEEYENCSIPEIDMQVDITFRERQAKAIENILSHAERLENKANKYDSLVEKMKEKLKEEDTYYNKSVNDIYKKPAEALVDFQRIIGKKEILQELLNTIKEEFRRTEKEQLKAELKKKDKIIYLMAFDIYGMQMECNRYFKDIEEVKQYFEKKVEEEYVENLQKEKQRMSIK